MLCEDLLKNISIPQMVPVSQHFDTEHLLDIPAAVAAALEREGTLDRIQPGMQVAITGGSRGISNIALILKTIGGLVKLRGANPFLVPAMGSHGGGSAEGQVAVLASLGITEAALEFPIRSCATPIEIGITPSGVAAMFDQFAWQADATIVVNRIKEHPAFIHRIESGLCKMIVIGLGKQQGADQCHRTHIHLLGPLIEEIATYTIPRSNIVFGVGILENAYDETYSLTAIPAERILEEEPTLLKLSKSLMPSICLSSFDILIMDEIGKNICGAGYDTKVIGRFPNPAVPDTTVFSRMAVLRLSKETHGNAMGISNADVCTSRMVEEMDREQSYLNSLTSLTPFSCKIPMHFPTDRQVIQAAIKLCPDLTRPESARIVRIHNTRNLGKISVSKNLLPDITSVDCMEIIGPPADLPFDCDGNLKDL